MKVNGSGSMTCRGTDRHGVKVWTLRATLRDGTRPSRTFHGSKTVQARLGHASITQTLDMYAHATPENDRRAADMIGNMLEAGNMPAGKVVNL